jgi:hypothetical protein
MSSLIQKVEGPFPTSYQLNRWADQEGGSRDSITKRVGRVSNKVRSISTGTTAGNISQNRRKFGIALINARKIRNVNVH